MSQSLSQSQRAHKKKTVDLHFFKRFAKQPKPVNDVVEEEIIVAPRLSQSSSQSVKPEDAPPTPKRDSARGSSTQPNSSNDVEVWSPSRPLPIGAPRKSSQLVQMDGAAESKPAYSSPTSSQSRTVEAAEITSPRISPPVFKEPEAPPRPPAESFSSTSTLSSVPMSSTSSSRRIIKNGIKAVTNSDSDADSDSDELADPLTFLSSKRRKLTPPGPGHSAAHAIIVSNSSAETVRQSTRLSNGVRKPNVGFRARLPPSPPRNVYKHSLMKLVKQRQDEEKTASRIRDAEAAFEEAQRKREERMKQDDDIGDELKVAVADDSDEGDRMLLAMQRTEALQEDEKFYFFRTGSRVTPLAFPSLQDSGGGFSRPWMKALQKEESRKQAFLSGFMADIADTEPLPSALTLWIANQFVFEPRTDLLEAYLQVLRTNVLQFSQGKDKVLGLDAFYKTQANLSKEECKAKASIPARRPRALSHVLQFSQQLCLSQAVFSASAASLVVDLMLAAIDENVKASAELVNEIHQVLHNVLDEIEDDDHFEAACKKIHLAFFDRNHLSKQRRCQVISSMPATSERTHRLRRVLALHLLMDFTRAEDYHRNLQSPGWFKTVKTRLESAPEFDISQTTNYKLLDALIDIVDVAIDAGFSDHTRSSMPPPAKPKAHFGKPSNVSSSEAAFNSKIDTLTQTLRSMSSQIRGSGTTHLKRTEAKSSLDRLILRLEHGVRTRPKPRKSIFDDSMGEQRDFLSSFLKPAAPKQETETEDGASVVPIEMLSDSEVSDGNQSLGETSAVSGAGAEST